MRYDRLYALLLLSLIVSFGGCSAYVNIPPQTGDKAFHDVNAQGVVTLMAKSLLAVMQQHAYDQVCQIKLPEGATPETYALVVGKVGEQAMWQVDGKITDRCVIQVRQIRIRSFEAQCDIVRPLSSNPNKKQWVTVWLKRNFAAKWRVTHLRIWDGNVDQALENAQQQIAQ